MIDNELIKQCAALCLASYKSDDDRFHDVDDLRYGVHQIDGLTFVTIRGTANAENWLRDADIFPIRSCGGHLAHAGFVEAYRTLCSGGMPTIKGLPNMVVTGHSLGGGIATLLAEHTGCRLITFGSPRVYFRFASAPKIEHARVVCDDDPVPMVPRLLYSHRVEPIVLKDSDNSMIEVKDHFMQHYYEMIERR